MDEYLCVAPSFWSVFYAHDLLDQLRFEPSILLKQIRRFAFVGLGEDNERVNLVPDMLAYEPRARLMEDDNDIY